MTPIFAVIGYPFAEGVDMIRPEWLNHNIMIIRINEDNE